jgi:hypothetical protein
MKYGERPRYFLGENGIEHQFWKVEDGFNFPLIGLTTASYLA